MPAEEIKSAKVGHPPKFGSPTCLAMKVGNLVYISGTLPWDAERNVVGVGDIKTQTRQALSNMEAVLAEVGGSLRSIVKITLFLTDIRDKQAVWDVRKEMFSDHRPASTLVEVNHLVDPNAKIEIEAVALIE